MDTLSNPENKASDMARSKRFTEFEDIVKATGNGAHVYVPKDWVGKRVRVILLEGRKVKE